MPTPIPKLVFTRRLAVVLLLGIGVDADAQTGVPSGFRALSNGSDLSGWHGVSPHRRVPDDPERRAALELEDQQSVKDHWRMENGEIVNDGQGAYLTTDEQFGDIELLVDYKTVAKADSGIYLRGTPQVQIWDTTEAGGKWGNGADLGSGGLYNNQVHPRSPLAHADREFGQWNAFRIRQIGQRTSVYLNDVLVVNDAIMENFWDRALPLPRRGPIMLQTHGGEIRWANLYVRDISPAEANRHLLARNLDGFEPVFNGRNLDGWSGAVENYEVRDGSIVCKPGKGGTLFTAQEFGDFVVRLEFKLPPGGNNGLAIRYPGSGDPAYHALCELQVLDSEHKKYAELDPRQYHGSAYGMVAAHRGYLRDAGEWNFQEVTVVGSKVTVELNGNTILDADLASVTDYKGGREHPGKELARGHFGFAGHSDPVQFRNIWIKSLD